MSINIGINYVDLSQPGSKRLPFESFKTRQWLFFQELLKRENFLIGRRPWKPVT